MEKLSFMIFLVLAILATSLLSGNGKRPMIDYCSSQLDGMDRECSQYLEGARSSPPYECCSMLEKTNIACICTHIPSLENAFDGLTGKCGLALTYGALCEKLGDALRTSPLLKGPLVGSLGFLPPDIPYKGQSMDSQSFPSPQNEVSTDSLSSLPPDIPYTGTLSVMPHPNGQLVGALSNSPPPKEDSIGASPPKEDTIGTSNNLPPLKLDFIGGSNNLP